MIPADHFFHVIQAERERDLKRWQRIHEARSATTPGGGAGGGLWALFRGALDARRRTERRPFAALTPQDGAAKAACC